MLSASDAYSTRRWYNYGSSVPRCWYIKAHVYRFAKEFYLFREHDLFPGSVHSAAMGGSLVKYSVCKCRLAFSGG